MNRLLRLHDEWVRWFIRMPPSLFWTMLTLIWIHFLYRLLAGESIFGFVPSIAEAPIQWIVMMLLFLVVGVPWFIRLMRIARESCAD